MNRMIMNSAFIAFLLGAISCSQRADTVWDELPRIKEAPMFQVTNYDGMPLSSKQLLGRPWIASFMFATCQGVCPIMNKHVADLQQAFGEYIRFVSFSVDPETDSLPVLAAYAREYGARPGVWYITRTSLDSVRMLSRDGFLLSDPKTPDLHSSRLVLVDDGGQIRGYYNSLDTSDIAQLRRLLQAYVERHVTLNQ
jgi:protein SCO1/2